MLISRGRCALRFQYNVLVSIMKLLSLFQKTDKSQLSIKILVLSSDIQACKPIHPSMKLQTEARANVSKDTKRKEFKLMQNASKTA